MNNPNPQGSQWQHAGTEMVACGPSAKKLPPGAYRFYKDWQRGVIAQPIPIKTEDLIRFKGGEVEYILTEIDRFWKSKDQYKAFNLAWRRGILMSGAPGNGKSGIIQMVVREVVKAGGVVAMVQRPDEFIESLPYLYAAEHNTPMVVVMEDVEHLLGSWEAQILEILDGSSDSKPGTIYLATTNHLDKLPLRIRNRPSRFDTVIEIPGMTEEMRRTFISKFDTGNLEALVAASDGLSIAHVKELIIATSIYGYTLEATVKRLQDLQKSADVDPAKQVQRAEDEDPVEDEATAVCGTEG